MASELIVQTLKGPTSGANANKVIVPAGQTLDASAGGMTLPAGVGGKLLQVIQVVTNSESYITSTSPTDTGYALNITPTASDTSILITLAGGRLAISDGGAHLQVRRNTTEIAPTNNIQRSGFGNTNGLQYPISLCVLDSSHNTTAQITYRVYAWVPNGGSVAINNSNVNNFSITAMEIAG